MGEHTLAGRRGAPERNRRWRRVGVVAGLLASSVIVWQSTSATFNSVTSNDTNTFGAGSVIITDNDGGSAAMFTAATMAPGDTATVCMGVKYSGSLTPTAIKVYTTGAQEANNGGAYGAWANDATSEMDDNLSMQIQVSSADLAADPGSNCAPAGVGSFTDVAAAAPGTNMQTMINTNKDYATGFNSQWGTVVANQWRVFKFKYTFASAAPTTAQGDGLKVNFVWEAQR